MHLAGARQTGGCVYLANSWRVSVRRSLEVPVVCLLRPVSVKICFSRDLATS